MSTDAILFEDNFIVSAIDAKKYDRAARITAENSVSGGDYKIELDINNELFQVLVGDTLVIALASTLSLDGQKDDSRLWRDISRGQTSLADMYEYVCHGKVYRFEESENFENLKVFVSFGGLLLYMEGPYKRLTPLRIDYVYLLARKA
ncbi:MAG: hypothetical protein GOMPHAMPRED_000599 [Gomphillus americanus]|uniref:DNA-directed RNA polymerases I, II, and III subunit RPABC3 n=1 Tax=Gomphillus americanus TaxID=1940652 RepID=A0A8H3I5B4_9LECA|nr:MAG: hypothetical protein GOMPHAMPRED_000599 [Gomphillus americanus]